MIVDRLNAIASIRAFLYSNLCACARLLLHARYGQNVCVGALSFAVACRRRLFARSLIRACSPLDARRSALGARAWYRSPLGACAFFCCCWALQEVAAFFIVLHARRLAYKRKNSHRKAKKRAAVRFGKSARTPPFKFSSLGRSRISYL